jgi:hypothetical protein
MRCPSLPQQGAAMAKKKTENEKKIDTLKILKQAKEMLLAAPKKSIKGDGAPALPGEKSAGMYKNLVESPRSEEEKEQLRKEIADFDTQIRQLGG